MAHVHGEKAVASLMKPAATAGTAHMMGSAMEGMGKMAMAEAKPMMKMSEGVSEAMRHSMNPSFAKGAATGAVVSASTSGGRGVISRIFSHPLMLLGLGIAAGYLIHKYRQEIIAAAAQVGEKGKDFVLQKRESLEDIVAESREAGETAGD